MFRRWGTKKTAGSTKNGRDSLPKNLGVKKFGGEVQRKINLVYGGGSVGLMGLIAQTVFDGGSHVLGINIPKALIPHEISGETIGEVKTVADMHERKSEMAKHANAFIALPGETEDGR